MKVIKTAIEDVVIIEPDVYGDDRGYFYESFNAKRFQEQTGIKTSFIQDNESKSVRSRTDSMILCTINKNTKTLTIETA